MKQQGEKTKSAQQSGSAASKQQRVSPGRQPDVNGESTKSTCFRRASVLFWLRRRTSTSNPMDCCAGITASSSGVPARRPASVGTSRTLGIVELVVRVDTARSAKSSDVNSTWQEVASTFHGQTCGKASQRGKTTILVHPEKQGILVKIG